MSRMTEHSKSNNALVASKNNYWSHSWVLIGFTIFYCILLPLYYEVVEGRSTDSFIIFLMIVFFIILCLPAIILLVRYSHVNNNVTVIYDNDIVYFELGKLARKLNIKDVEQVEFKASISVSYDRPRLFATDSFMYANIILKTGEHFTVTSLLDLELLKTEKFFRHQVPITKKIRFICWPPISEINPEAK